MINATLNSLRTIDDELFNRVRAFGPGDGLNRYSVTVEDASSIATYGLRETIQDFVTATSVSDLTTLANEYLAAHAEPVTEVDITFYYDIEMQLDDVLYEGEAILYDGEVLKFWRYGNAQDIRRGDTIRLVSESLNLNITGVIAELSWEPGIINIVIGKERYNLVDVLNGPQQERDRKTAALGLPTPVGLRAQRAEPGCRVFVNPYVNSRAVGVEIYAGATDSFTPSVANLVARGASTEFNVPQLTSGQIFYFKARSYDATGYYSEPTAAVQAVSGFVQGGRIEGGTIDIDKFVGDARPIKIVTSLPPVISVDDPDYKVGMLVNLFNLPSSSGKLYRLVSTTGVPATDWVPAVGTGSIEAGTITADEINAGSVSTAILVADAIKAGMIDASAVTAREIAAGTITADKITAGTITATQIASSTITGSLIASSTITGANISGGTITGANLVNATIEGDKLDDYIIDSVKLALGTIHVNNPDDGTTNRKFVVQNSAGVDQVAMGNITGRTGVPDGTQFGFWGTLGTNIYIRGTMRLISIGESYADEVWDNSTYNVGDAAVFNQDLDILGSTTVRDGTRLVIVPMVQEITSPDTSTFRILQYDYRLRVDDDIVTGYTVAAGSYDSIKLNFTGQMEIRSFSGGTPDACTCQVGVHYMVYEEIL
jgi:hypothetical protein